MELLSFVIGMTITSILLIQLLIHMLRTGQRWSLERQQLAYNNEHWETRLQKAKLRLKEIETSKQHWSGARKFELGKKVFENEAKTICSFYFYPHDRKPLPSFSPGQYLGIGFDIPDPDDPSETSEEHRCYSLSDSPNPIYYRISVRCVPPPRGNPDGFPPGLVSNHLHDNVEEGDLVDIQAPSGDFFLDMSEDSPVCLIAGGVGLTPILSMCNTLANEKSHREVWVFYGVRNTQDMALEQEFVKCLDTLDDLKVMLCYSDVVPDTPSGNENLQRLSGRADIKMLQKMLPHNNYEYFFCGPGPMMTSLHKGLLSWGVPDKDINYEFFAPEETAAPAAAAAPTGGGQEFKVDFAISDKSLAWTNEKSLYDLKRKKNFKCKKIKYSCKQGKCGSCMTAIKTGTVAYLGEQPTFPGLLEGSCLPCICTPSSDLQLEA
jgi:uncharacterized protein